MALQLQNQFLRISIQVHFSLERCAIAGAQAAFLSFKNIHSGRAVLAGTANFGPFSKIGQTAVLASTAHPCHSC